MIQKNLTLLLIVFLVACGSKSETEIQTLSLSENAFSCTQYVTSSQPFIDELAAQGATIGSCDSDKSIGMCFSYASDLNKTTIYYIDNTGQTDLASNQASCENDDGNFSKESSNNDLRNPDFCVDCAGVVTTDVGINESYSFGVAQQNDGKIISLGHLSGVNSFVVTRYNLDGTLDLSFAENGIQLVSNGTGSNVLNISSLMLQQDGKILLIGEYRGINSLVHAHIIRLNIDGTMDTTFGAQGMLSIQEVREVNGATLQSNGQIVITGANNDFNIILARFNTDGSPDNSLGTNGILVQPDDASVAESVTIQSDGRIIIAGYLSKVPPGGGNYNKELFAMRFLENGDFDENFATSGIFSHTGIVSQGNSVLVQEDGGVVIGGVQDGRAMVMRLTSDGALDNTFNDDGIFSFGQSDSNSRIYNMVQQHDGKILGYSMINAVISVLRLNSDGSLDSTFIGEDEQAEGIITTDITIASSHLEGRDDSLIQQEDGKILVAGYTFTDAMGNSNKAIMALARYNSDGSADAGNFGSN